MAKLLIEDNAFDPIEIEYKGEIFTVTHITTAVLLKINEREVEMLAGNIKAVDESLLLYSNITKKVLDQLDLRQKNAILIYIRQSLEQPEQYQTYIKKKTKKVDEPSTGK